jgi:hypothetical protein
MRYLPLDFVVIVFTFSISCSVGGIALFSLLLRNFALTYVLFGLYFIALVIFITAVWDADSEEKLVQRRAI